MTRPEAKRRLGAAIASRITEDDAELSKILGIPCETITKVKSGRGRFKREYVRKLLNHIKVSLIRNKGFDPEKIEDSVSESFMASNGLGKNLVSKFTFIIFSKRDHGRGRRFDRRTATRQLSCI